MGLPRVTENTVIDVRKGFCDLTFRIDKASRGGQGLRVEVVAADERPAAFTVVAGP